MEVRNINNTRPGVNNFKALKIEPNCIEEFKKCLKDSIELEKHVRRCTKKTPFVFSDKFIQELGEKQKDNPIDIVIGKIFSGGKELLGAKLRIRKSTLAESPLEFNVKLSRNPKAEDIEDSFCAVTPSIQEKLSTYAQYADKSFEYLSNCLKENKVPDLKDFVQKIAQK